MSILNYTFLARRDSGNRKLHLTNRHNHERKKSTDTDLDLPSLTNGGQKSPSLKFEDEDNNNTDVDSNVMDLLKNMIGEIKQERNSEEACSPAKISKLDDSDSAVSPETNGFSDESLDLGNQLLKVCQKFENSDDSKVKLILENVKNLVALSK